MFKREREIPVLEKLNIVPIMDAVFIFIFFLLFSAQFIKIFEIETEAPIVSEVPENIKLDKDPLNLIVKLYKRKIVMHTGVDQIVAGTYYKNDKSYRSKMKKKLMDLRLSHPKDDFVVISPDPLIEYDEIIKTIDIVQTIPGGKEFKIKIKGKVRNLKKIFTQIVLEPMDEL